MSPERRHDNTSHGFVETSVSARVFDTIDRAVSFEWNAAIVGSPGVGKTRALREYVIRNQDTIFLEVTPLLSKSLHALLSEVADLAGIYTPSGNIIDIERRFSRYAHGKKVVVLDEAQNLPLKSIRQLLHFSVEDGGEFVFVFCGNDQVLKQTKVDQSAFGQINRRIPFREIISSISDDDADAIASSAGVEGIEAFKMLREVAERFQAGGVVQAIEVAKRFAPGKVVRAEHLRQALAVLPQFQMVLRPPTVRKTATK